MKSAKTAQTNTGDLISLGDELRVLDVVHSTVQNLWKSVNELTRLRPTRRADHVPVGAGERVEAERGEDVPGGEGPTVIVPGEPLRGEPLKGDRAHERLQPEAADGACPAAGRKDVVAAGRVVARRNRRARPHEHRPCVAHTRGELRTEEWCDVIDQLATLGFVKLNLTGGEPLLRADLPTLVAHARGAGVPNVHLHVLNRDGGPTTVKRRFVDPSYMRKLFEVAILDDEPLNASLQQRFDDNGSHKNWSGHLGDWDGGMSVYPWRMFDDVNMPLDIVSSAMISFGLL